MLDDYAEANAWQSLWMTGLHDPDGLAEILGGRDAAVDKLTDFFEQAKDDWDTSGPTAFPRPYYWHGNEPDINAPFIFAQLGRPDLTQQWVRWIADTLYTDQPDGIQGNDDGGTLGSWYVLATLGLFPISGADGYVLGAPRFPRARVVIGGHELVIEADGISDAAMYVDAVYLDDTPIDAPALSQADLTRAASLRFVMSAQPTSWGR
jgi:putative alpha-1,2-mannosidase